MMVARTTLENYSLHSGLFLVSTVRENHKGGYLGSEEMEEVEVIFLFLGAGLEESALWTCSPTFNTDLRIPSSNSSFICSIKGELSWALSGMIVMKEGGGVG